MELAETPDTPHLAPPGLQGIVALLLSIAYPCPEGFLYTTMVPNCHESVPLSRPVRCSNARVPGAGVCLRQHL